MEKADSNKPLALLIPGLDGTGRLYYRQIDALSAKYRVRPWEFSPRGSFDLSDLVQEVAKGTENETQRSILIVGESFGGMIAMQFALDYPDRIARMALVNTFPRYRRRIRIHLGCRLAGLMERSIPRQVKNFVVERTLAAEGILAEDRRHYHDAINHIYHPAYCRRLQLVRDVDLRKRLQEITIPTSLFASGRDKLVPSIAEARYMHSILPNARIYEFPDAGHALLLTPGFTLAEYLT